MGAQIAGRLLARNRRSRTGEGSLTCCASAVQKGMSAGLAVIGATMTYEAQLNAEDVCREVISQ